MLPIGIRERPTLIARGRGRGDGLSLDVLIRGTAARTRGVAHPDPDPVGACRQKDAGELRREYGMCSRGPTAHGRPASGARDPGDCLSVGEWAGPAQEVKSFNTSRVLQAI